jgi:hypothetical protein
MLSATYQIPCRLQENRNPSIRRTKAPKLLLLPPVGLTIGQPLALSPAATVQPMSDFPAACSSVVEPKPAAGYYEPPQPKLITKHRSANRSGLVSRLSDRRFLQVIASVRCR